MRGRRIRMARDARLLEQVSLQVEVTAKYSGYLKRQVDEIERQRRHEELPLPADIDYAQVGGLSNEARSAWATCVRHLGQAARIPGLTPRGVPAAGPSEEARPRRMSRGAG